MSKKNLLDILPLVSKPSRYIGAEVNSCLKDPAQVALRVALCFPDAYEVGISHLGLKVLYEVLNSREDIYAERAYSPWPDMEEELKEHGIPLSTVETGTSLSDMDIVAFTLQYELSYSNILNMLALSGIPLRRTDRDDSHPLVVAGGPCAFNPEPLADFIDAFVIGDAEEAILEMADAVIAHKKDGALGGRAALLAKLALMEGVYVPAHFEVSYNEDGSIKDIKNVAGGPDRVRKRTVRDLETAPFPAKALLPYAAAVHDRITLEISRGCSRGCRFCQAGYIYRPVRERSPERLMALAEEAVCSTGYDEMSLSSLSTGDYGQLLPLMTAMMDRFGPERVSISLPSLRVGTLTPEMCRQISRVRKTGFTIAPEAGTQRLRDVINKNITEDGLVETAETVFREGWDLIKLYFMTGLPTETDADLDGIIHLSRRVLDAGKRAGGRKKMVNVGVSAFVPKPHTPFQWMGQIPMPEIRRRKDYLRRALGKKPFALKSEFAETSVLEAAFARGERKLGGALYNAWAAGARFDSWSEMFNWDLWVEAFKKAGLDIETEASRDYRTDEVLPWDHIDSGVDKKFLLKELEKAVLMASTPDCRVKCSACGLKCRPEGEALTPAPRSNPGATPLPAGEGKTANGPSARVRLKYTKLSPLSLLSHNELMTVFFRAISRAGLPILFSEGFNPHPKLSFGPALAVGVESEAEILDIELSYGIDLKNVVKTLNRTLPAGIRILEGRILRTGEPAAGVGLTSFTYEAEAPDEFEGSLSSAVSAFLAAGAAVVSRKSDKGTKELDIRPMVRDITVTGPRTIRFALQESEGKSAKPHEIGQALFGMSPEGSRALKVKRTALN